MLHFSVTEIIMSCYRPLYMLHYSVTENIMSCYRPLYMLHFSVTEILSVVTAFIHVTF